MQRIILACSLIMCSLASPAAMYKWVDEEGITQFSQYPPEGQPAETLRPPPPPAEDPATARQRLQKQVDDFDNRRLQEKEQLLTEEKTAEKERRRKENCQAARSNLAILQQGGHRSLQTESGEVIRPTDEQRQARVQAAEKAIQEHCTPGE